MGGTFVGHLGFQINVLVCVWPLWFWLLLTVWCGLLTHKWLSSVTCCLAIPQCLSVQTKEKKKDQSCRRGRPLWFTLRLKPALKKWPCDYRYLWENYLWSRKCSLSDEKCAILLQMLSHVKLFFFFINWTVQRLFVFLPGLFFDTVPMSVLLFRHPEWSQIKLSCMLLLK